MIKGLLSQLLLYMLNTNFYGLPPADKGPQTQVLFVDGHKVTVRYSGEKNPPALRAIKNVLINSVSIKKD